MSASPVTVLFAKRLHATFSWSGDRTTASVLANTTPWWRDPELLVAADSKP